MRIFVPQYCVEFAFLAGEQVEVTVAIEVQQLDAVELMPAGPPMS